MPNLKREHLSAALLAPLASRIRQCNVPIPGLVELSQWLDGNPSVPPGKWFKRFPQFVVCGEGELVKTFSLIGERPDGVELE